MNTTEPFRPEERQTAEAPLLTGSQALIESFLREGVETVFGYPGGAIIPVYDALYDYRDRLRHILVRHEQGAVHAAQGYARVSGRVGVCLVTSGPGATNTVTGLADALMDSTPLVLVTGQVGSTLLGTDAFQETNFVGITQAVTKWNCQVKYPEEIPAAIAKAFYIARSGRPGPVVVDITKDAQCATAPFRYERITSIRSYAPSLTPDARRIEEAARLIDEARRPLAMIGQGAILGNAEAELRAFLDRSGMPAASTLLGLSALPSDDPRNVGMLGMHGNYGPNIKNKECDLLVAVGMRFDDRVTGDPAAFGPNARIIHLEIDPSEIDKIVHADVPLVGDVKRTLPLLTERIRPRDHSAWIEEFRACDRIEYERVVRRAIRPDGGRIRMGEAVDAVARAYDRDAVMVTDVGQQQMFAARYFGFRRSRSVVTSGGLGTMGFGLPAAIGAKLGAPDRDTLLIRTVPHGPTCHTGTQSCFGEAVPETEGFIRRLQAVVRQRHAAMPEGSYTSKLFNRGVNKIAQKVGEEAVETVIEAVAQNREAMIYEASDLVYHLLVLLEATGCSIADLERELSARHA